MGSPVAFMGELHDYQEEALAKWCAAHHLSDSGAAFRALLSSAAAHPELWTEIFRTVHCRRCDNLPDNLSTADNAWKKSKKPVSFGLTSEQDLFLEARVANEEGAEIAEKGPVNRAIADTGKAARTIIDYALNQEEADVDLSSVFAAADETAAAEIPFEVHAIPEVDDSGAAAGGGDLIDYAEVMLHNTETDLWVVVGDKVYDVTSQALPATLGFTGISLINAACS